MPTATRSPLPLLLLFAACPALAQQSPDATALVAALADAKQRPAAREGLVALGAAAVPAVRARLATALLPELEDLLEILTRLGPAAGPALPDVRALLPRTRLDSVPLLNTLAELAPWHALSPADVAAVAQEAFMVRMRLRRNCGDPRPEDALAEERWRCRASFPRALDVPTLVTIARDRNALRIELAVEFLGQRGAAAAEALPMLRALLDRPEPRLLLTERRLPLYRKAATAILAIGPQGEQAAVARDVLANRRAPPAREPPSVPPRLQERIDLLIADLAAPARRPDAIVNLTALGEPACLPVAKLLSAQVDAPTTTAALVVLRDLGPGGAAAVGPLFTALTTLPAEHAVAVVEALGATVPWCSDVVPTILRVGGLPDYRILGQPPVGKIDAEWATRFGRAVARLTAIQRVSREFLLAEFESPLTDRTVEVRERALELVAERGSAARPLLPLVAAMLRETQIKHHEYDWFSETGRTITTDRTEHVHRCAARAILAIAAPDDPLRAEAERVLAQPEPK